LFEGGNADLILTNEDNILEAGIEIMVQPPGKKHQNINLLSGGEKSLVAIALLFSFFMVKPSPVCILDESDAQLDETNVVRFMKLLREFSKDTKFIVITHNTRTMEFLDTLYGITMEELGVSKVIAIRFQHAEVAV
jgi:chromosome segregation protein